MQLALGELLKIPAPRELFARRRERALTALEAAGYDVPASQATFFLYPRAPGGDDLAFSERLAERGVMVLPAAVFHHAGHFRISVTCSDDMLERGLSVLAQARGEG
jgi:aspartate aminotransferase